MSIELLSAPTLLRRHLKRLVTSAERIDLFVPSFDDAALTTLLIAARARGAEVHLTTNLDPSTDPDAMKLLHDAGVVIGEVVPAVYRRRTFRRFAPGLMLFDHETDWWTAAIVGTFTATKDSLDHDLGIATLFESSTFDGTDPAGEAIIQILDYSDSVVPAPADARRLEKHRRERAAASTPEPGPRIIEPKPAAFHSAVSWQELRRCDWGTYWGALAARDQRDRPRGTKDLSGPRGWLFGIERAQVAFRAGPEGWAQDDIRSELLGRTPVTRVLGRVPGASLSARLADDAEFRATLHATIEASVAQPGADELRTVLGPMAASGRITVAELSRLLAVAAPDRFFSILDEAARLRMSDIVGFELGESGTDPLDQLQRYLDAIELARRFPWVAEPSAERTSDHPREADAWSQRVALLGCLVG